MAELVTYIKIFLASPGDVKNERKEIVKAINELNSVLNKEKKVTLDLLNWERDTHPAMGRAQEEINKQIGEYDIFIGLMWKKFGQPTGSANSGTEEEFQLAYKSWEIIQKPHILFYFSTKHFWPESIDDIDQIKKVFEFRQSLYSKGLIGEYHTPRELVDKIKHDITKVVDEILIKYSESNSKKNEIKEGQRNVVTIISDSDIADDEHIVRAIKNVYNKYNVRGFSTNLSNKKNVVHAIYTLDRITERDSEYLKKVIKTMGYNVIIDNPIRVRIDEIN